jgi:alanine-glyoxylate transaminase / serine-glyoxylate transaminase / serine-pyruvate transaminase
VSPPPDVDEGAIRKGLLLEHSIEISGGLGPLAGKLWRIGVMGVGAQREPQERLVSALATLLDADPAEPLAALAEGWRA